MSGPPPHAAYGAQGYGPTYAEGGYGAQVPMHSQAAGVAHAGDHAFDAGQFAKEAGNIFGSSFTPLAQTAVAAYGEKAQHFVQSRMSFFSGPLSKNLQYYYNVNTKYVLNKIKLLLCPFIHKGSWTRIPEQVPGGFQFKPPRHDLNAPDLYIPSMAFNTYCVLCSLVYSTSSKCTPERFGRVAWAGMLIWACEVLMLRSATYLLSTNQIRLKVPFFDLCAYGGYVFVHVNTQVLVRFFAGTWGYWVSLAWGNLCMGVFLVKTMRRIYFSQTRNASTYNVRKQNYMLLAVAFVQVPLTYWLGQIY